MMSSFQIMASDLVIEKTDGGKQSHDIALIGKWKFIGKELQLLDKNGELLASENVLKIRKIVFYTNSQEAQRISKSEHLIIVYPNPTKDMLYIEGAEEQIIRVYNRSGVFLLRNKGKQVDVSALPADIYLLQIGTQVVRFIKQ